jgi:AcrR family transcriptional regulator
MSERLSADDWIQAGLRALAREGFPGLKADLLARSLGISRGSFYWHFADIGAFHEAVRSRWQEVAADAIIRDLERATTPADRLRRLLRLAFTADAALEIGMRAWAASDAQARAAVEAVDRRRLAYLERLLTAAGVRPAAARARAHILYWAYLGFALSGRPVPRVRLEAVLAELAMLGRGGRARGPAPS